MNTLMHVQNSSDAKSFQTEIYAEAYVTCEPCYMLCEEHDLT